MRSQKNTKFINIKIKTLNHSIFQIFANPSQPIFTIQGQIQQVQFLFNIQKKTSVPVGAQRLLYRGISLQTTRSFVNYDIGENNIISLIANKLPSQFSQSSSLRRSEIQKINSLNKQHLKYKKHMLLQQRSSGFRLQVDESIQVMSQNKHVIDKLMQVLNYNYAQQSMPFKLDKRKMKVGEWVDVRDLSGVWSQGQVVAMYNEYIKVHYNGWPQRMNEWIPETSQRIMPFRSHTVQQQSSPYLSPLPKYEATISKHSNPTFQPPIQTLINQLQTTITNFNKLLKQLQLQDKQSHTQNNDYMMLMIENQSHNNLHLLHDGSVHQHGSEHQNQHHIILQGKLNNNANNNITGITGLENNQHNTSQFTNKDIDYYEVQMDKKQQFYTPSKQIRANDNLSNKAEDDVVSKCDKDDISNKSNKSFKSKRSEGLVDTQSMKSLIIDQKKRSSNIFFDSTQAQSVKSVKNHSKYHHYLGTNNKNQQYQYIIQESDSQTNDRQDKDNHNSNENYLSFRKKEYKRKMKASQLAPLSDRLGRLLVDLAPHFAMLGYQQQGINNFSENLSTFTNQGSLQSKLAKAQKRVSEHQQQQDENNNSNNNQQQNKQTNKVYYSQSPYCQFQIPVMLTPNQITLLTKLLDQQKRVNQAQI